MPCLASPDIFQPPSGMVRLFMSSFGTLYRDLAVRLFLGRVALDRAVCGAIGVRHRVEVVECTSNSNRVH
jgi:hypothetical protein